MIGVVKDSVSMPVGAAGGPGPRRLSREGRPPWRIILVVALTAAVLAPLCVFAPGCSSKPAAKKRAKKAKRPETGLAELAGAEGSGEQALAPPESADGATGKATPPAGVEADNAAAGVDGADVTAAAPTVDDTVPPAPAEPPPPEIPDRAPSEGAPPAPSLDGLAAAGSDGANRPTSKLIDSDTALLLDGGRVEVSSPLGWTRSPRSQNYLVRYQPGPRKSYPSIVVTVEPAPEGLVEITAANQPDLVAAIGSKLAATFPAGGAVKLIKKPAAATFGPHRGVAWAMPGTAKVGGLSEPIERFASGVVLGGRLYTVEVRAPKGKVDDDAKAAAKAVAATLFRPAGAPAGDPEGPVPGTDPAQPAAGGGPAVVE